MMTYAYHPTDAQIDFIYDLIQHYKDHGGSLELDHEAVMTLSSHHFENYLDMVISIHHVFQATTGLSPEEKAGEIQVLRHWLECFQAQAATNSPDNAAHFVKMDPLLHEARRSGPPGWFYDKGRLQDQFESYDRNFVSQFEVTDPSQQLRIFDEQGNATGDLSFTVRIVPGYILRTELQAMAFKNEAATARAISQLRQASPEDAYNVTSVIAAECVARFTSSQSPLYNSVILHRHPRPGLYMGACVQTAFLSASAEKTSRQSDDAPNNLATLMFENPAYVQRGLPEDMFRHLMAKKASDDYKNHALMLPMIKQVVAMGFPLLKLASACLVNTWLGFDSDEDGLRDSAIFLLDAALRAPKLSTPNRDALLGLWYIKTAPVSELLALPLKDEARVFLHEMTRSSEFLQGIKNKKLRDQVIGSDLGL
ncbi:hypothetical protein ALP54_03724 [Pseudomonas amygdali pv. lachrymans]|nr:hypothetical protein ALP54_03724 [Pseudomonas amygdali pv. lachrymans]